MNINLRALGHEIEKALAGRSQSWLARKSGVGQSTISRLIRGKAKPTPETLEALAIALELEPSRFMKLAGIPLPIISDNNIDPAIAYIARRLVDLPSTYREFAIDALGAQLDVIYDLYEQHKQATEALESQLRAMSQLETEERNGSSAQVDDKEPEERSAVDISVPEMIPEAEELIQRLAGLPESHQRDITVVLRGVFELIEETTR